MKKALQFLILGIQHIFAMFGATVLVPLLTGLDAGVALVSSGVGTLIYIICTKGKVPMYLGSSFAYIGAIATAGATVGYSGAYFGLMLVGIIYAAIAMVIHFVGSGWLRKILPPVVVGPMIIIIGMSLAPIAINSAGFDGSQGLLVPLVALITFSTVVGISLLTKGFIKIIPFIIAISVGYVFAAIFGLVDFSIYSSYSFFQIPNFTFIGTYAFNAQHLLVFAPLAFVTIAEHIGDHIVLGEIIGKDYITDPGLDKTLLGDGIATFVAAAIGGPANTSYGENTGVVAMTKVSDIRVIIIAAVGAILLGFLGYVQAFIASIPWAVIGGITIVLYGLIAANGVKVLISNKINLGNMRNLIIISSMLVIGLGGAQIIIGSATLQGMSIAAITGIILNSILPENISE